MFIRITTLFALLLAASCAEAHDTPCKNGSLSPADKERHCQCTSSWPIAKKNSLGGFKLYAVCENERDSDPTVGEFYYRGTLVASGKMLASHKEVVGADVEFHSSRIPIPLRFSYPTWKTLGLPASFEQRIECWGSPFNIRIKGIVAVSFENHNDGTFIDNFEVLSKGPLKKCKE